VKRAFKQVDVFTDTPLKGNPLAVVLEGGGLDKETMQRFTDWTNLSEAAFLSQPTHADADYAVRIFCPGRELPFAGHPTLGSCHAWLQAGGQPRGEVIVQECGIGLVRIRRDGQRLAFAAHDGAQVLLAQGAAVRRIEGMRAQADIRHRAQDRRKPDLRIGPANAHALCGVVDADFAYAGEVCTEVMNQLGGNFSSIMGENENSWIIRGTKCPWRGEEARKNPILCTLTRKIFSNIVLKVDSDFSLEARKTIGNKNDCCEFIIKVE